MNKIYVGNLSFKVIEDDLRTEFRKFGEIKEIALIKDRSTGESKGFGFITYASREGAKSALSLNGKELGGRTVKVNMAIEREKDDRRGGNSYGGRSNRNGKYGGHRERW